MCCQNVVIDKSPVVVTLASWHEDDGGEPAVELRDPKYPDLGPGSARHGACQLVGASLSFADGQPTTHFQLDAALNVLYGLNGSGKTRTLAALARALGAAAEQTAERAWIHVSVPATATVRELNETPGTPAMAGEAARRLASAFERNVPEEDWDLYENVMSEAFESRIMEGETLLGGLASGIADVCELGSEVAQSLRDDLRFIFVPRTSGGGADLYLAVKASDERLQDVWAAADKFLAEFSDVDLTDLAADDHVAQALRLWGWVGSGVLAEVERVARLGYLVELTDLRMRFNAARDALGEGADRDALAREAVRITREPDYCEPPSTNQLIARRLMVQWSALDQGGILPAWASIPIFPLGTIHLDQTQWRRDFQVVTNVGRSPEAELNAIECRIEEWLRSASDARETPILTTGAAGVDLNPLLRAEVEQVTERASETLRDLLGDEAPSLAIHIDPEAALRGRRLIALGADDYSAWEHIPIRSLSEAQQRWAAVCLNLAYAEVVERNSARALLLDEPDASLHISARRAISVRLAELTRTHGIPVVASTHGVELIDRSEARLWHTSRADDRRLRRVTTSELAAMAPDESGLSSSDVLLMTRAWVIVEGDHDQAVLQEWLGDTLAQVRARILKMRGTDNALTILDSQLLHETTDAAVVVVVDHVKAELTDTLNALLQVQRADPARREENLQVLDRLRKRQQPGGEGATLVALAQEACKRGRPTRLKLVGLTKPDVIEYLPAEAFVPGATWQALVAEWRATPRVQGRPTQPFKSWLRRAKGAVVTTENIAKVASCQDALHEDFIRLDAVLREV